MEIRDVFREVRCRVENRDGKRITGDLRESNRKSGNGAENGREPLDFGISDID